MIKSLCSLQLSERTDSQLENLHLCLMLWDGVLQLGEEVETWTNSRTAALSQGPSFQTEDDIKALQVKPILCCVSEHELLLVMIPQLAF